MQGVWEPGAPQPSHAAVEDEPSQEIETQIETQIETHVDGRAEQLRLFEPAPAAAAAPVMRREPVMQEAAQAPVARGLSRDAQRLLQAALHELAECRRVLDAALTEPAG